MSSHSHAIVWIDHSSARIFYVGLTGDNELTLHSAQPSSHLHHKANTIGSGHLPLDIEFFDRVIESVRDVTGILILGPSTAKVELARHARKRHSDVADRIVAVETSDHPTDGELLAHGKQFFGIPTARAGASPPSKG